MEGHGRWVDAGWTLSGRWVDAEWTVGGRWVDAGWTLGGSRVDGTKKNGNGRWTVWPRKGTGWSWKLNGMVTEAGRDGHGSWTGWSRKVVKIERFTVTKLLKFSSKIAPKFVPDKLKF